MLFLIFLAHLSFFLSVLSCPSLLSKLLVLQRRLSNSRPALHGMSLGRLTKVAGPQHAAFETSICIAKSVQMLLLYWHPANRWNLIFASACGLLSPWRLLVLSKVAPHNANGCPWFAADAHHMLLVPSCFFRKCLDGSRSHNAPVPHGHEVLVTIKTSAKPRTFKPPPRQFAPLWFSGYPMEHLATKFEGFSFVRLLFKSLVRCLTVFTHLILCY